MNGSSCTPFQSFLRWSSRSEHALALLAAGQLLLEAHVHHPRRRLQQKYIQNHAATKGIAGLSCLTRIIAFREADLLKRDLRL